MRDVAVAPLTDGLASLENGDECLTKCACWAVQLGGYNATPLVVPYDTSLDDVEALARRALVENLSWQPDPGMTVAKLRVAKIERLHEVLLSPRLG